MHDAELIYGILKANHEVFTALVKQNQPSVFRTLMGLAHNKEDAEEITQDVFVKLIRRF